MKVILDQEGICKKSDNDIVWGALMARCLNLERVMEKRTLTPLEQLSMQDEYERTFALTEKYRK